MISNCVNNVAGDGASLTRGGVEFVAYSNSEAGDVYYIGVKSEDQEAAEYAFIPVFQPTAIQPDGRQGQRNRHRSVPLPVKHSRRQPGASWIGAMLLRSHSSQSKLET